MVNNEDRFAMLTLRPHKSWTIRNEFHALRLSDRKDLWYLGGGAFQPWTFGYIGRNTSGARSLANQYDVSVDYNKDDAALGWAGQALALAEAIQSRHLQAAQNWL